MGRCARRLDRQIQRQRSEIFAGVIRDYGRGLIIGDTSTFGKGTVQQIVMINDHVRRRSRQNPAINRGALKLTIQQFYRANGESTQINGVPPHIHIPSMNDHRDFGEEKMDNAFKFDKVGGLPHDNYNRVPTDLVARLNERSADRRKAIPSFRSSKTRSRSTSIARPDTRFRSTKRNSGQSTFPMTPKKKPPKRSSRKNARRRNLRSGRSGLRIFTTTR